MRVLISGPQGCGKTMLANFIADFYKYELKQRVLIRDHDSPSAYADPEFDIVITTEQTER